MGDDSSREQLQGERDRERTVRAVVTVGICRLRVWQRGGARGASEASSVVRGRQAGAHGTLMIGGQCCSLCFSAGCVRGASREVEIEDVMYLE